MYAELQCKTNFSFLRGASGAHEYLERASHLGFSAIAITDINGVYALPRAYEAAKNISTLKLISGCELRLKGHLSITLLAKDRKSYGVMCRILTAAHQGKEKGKGELSIPELIAFLDQAEASGLFALCQVTEKNHFPLLTHLPLLKEALGDRLFLSLSHYLDGMDDERTQRALSASTKHGLRIVATNDVHYHVPERRQLQDVLTCIREGVTLKTAGFKLFPNEERYLKSPLQMCSLFRELPDAIQATLDIAERCHFSLSELSYQYPSEWIPHGYTAQRYLEELVWRGAYSRYKGMIPIEVEKQIFHELQLIQKMNYSDYFLTVYDIVDFAKKNQIYCQGRGSAANSIVCFCLGITVIDPVKMTLLFERFMSEDRGEPPDIDVDFEHERREDVIQYIYNKYGRDRAAMISAVRTYQKRSALSEITQVIGASESENNRLKIEQLAQTVIGFPRHLSIHACGFTLSANSMIETVPIEPARMEARTICQWDKHDLDTLKLIKIDVLGLGFLTVIHKTCALIGIHFWDIPQEDDPQVYGMIQKGDTIGTFQIESRAQISTLGITQPENFYDLVVEVALVRPGPNVGDMKTPYITRRENAKRGIPTLFEDPETEKILGRTYGIPIFQEQIMKLAIVKAGFSPSEADQLRRAIAAWRSAEAVDALSARFYQGLISGGMSELRAQELFGYMKGFSAYGFPESHAASFAILSYLSAWLKYYHPAELLCSLINSQPMGFYPIDVLINDAIRHEVKVLPIDPHLSVWDAILEKKMTIRMGFRNIQGIRKYDFDHLVKTRAQSRFKNLHDFLSRTQFQKDVIDTMAMSGVFSSFGMDPRHTFWSSLELRSILEYKRNEQLNLFESQSKLEPPTETQIKSTLFPPMTLLEGILEDYRGLEYSLRGNVMAGVRLEDPSLPKTHSLEIKKRPHGAYVIYAGIVLLIQRPPTANGVTFITLEDEFGSVDLVCFKKTYERYSSIIQRTRHIIITGKVERRGKSVSVLINSVKSTTRLI